MALVNFEFTYKLTAQNLIDYNKVKTDVDATDLLAMGQNVVMTTNPDDDPANFVISRKVTGQNDPPA